LEEIMLEENEENAPVAQVCVRTGTAIAAVLDFAEDRSIVLAEEVKEVSVLRGAAETEKEVLVQPRLPGRDRRAVTVKKTLLACLVKNTRSTVTAGERNSF
jgi:hypothetical protein